MAGRDTEPLLRWDVGKAVICVAVSHDGAKVVSGLHNGAVCVWNTRTGARILGPLKKHTGWVRAVSWSHDDSRIVSGSEDTTIRIWDARTGTPIGKPLVGHTGLVWDVTFSPDGTRIVCGSEDRSIYVWDAYTGALIGEPLRGHADAVLAVAFSPDSGRIVSGSADCTLRIWDARSGALIGEPLLGHVDSVWEVEFSSNSTRIVSGSEDHTIRIWDALTGAPIGEPLRGHTDAVWTARFSPDSTRIASGSRDNFIRLWNASTGVPMGELPMKHDGAVFSVAFSPDSRSIVSGSSDETMHVWQVPQIPLSFDMVTSRMSAQEMFNCLVKHGCADLTPSTKSNRHTSAVVAYGGFGDVRRMVMDDGTVVAVKTLRLHILLKDNDKAVKRAIREVYIWSKLRHMNIQELLGIIVFDGALGMVSLWREQGNLKQYIAANPDAERYPLCIQLTSGVTYLHGVDMVHGDLKAINVLVSEDGTLKISDFDYAILPDSTLHFSATTRLGGGTLRWMAPELLEPEGEDAAGETHFEATRNKQTDIYALGMTILEIITGAVPYSEYRTDMGIYRAIHNKQFPRRPAELPSPDTRAEMMWLLLLECWDHDPTARPDAAAVLELLQFKRPAGIKRASAKEAERKEPDILSASTSTTSRPNKFPEKVFPE